VYKERIPEAKWKRRFEGRASQPDECRGVALRLLP
jgi:hypothetical protein